MNVVSGHEGRSRKKAVGPLANRLCPDFSLNTGKGDLPAFLYEKDSDFLWISYYRIMANVRNPAMLNIATIISP